MHHLKLTLDTPAENLALDEALLDAAEAGEMPAGVLSAGVLRLWESPTYCVVLGRSSVADVEVNLEACRRDRIPVLRRSSGGGTILAGPGCLMYALVLGFQDHPQLQAIDRAHEFVLENLSQILSQMLSSPETSPETTVAPHGTSDLAIRRAATGPWQKLSGNAMRLKRRHILYHGTLLYDFDLERLPRWLAAPTRTPAYRDEREHAEFVTNLNVGREALCKTLVKGWQADEALPAWPEERTANLVQKKYIDNPKWTLHLPAGTKR